MLEGWGEAEGVCPRPNVKRVGCGGGSRQSLCLALAASKVG